MRIHILGSAAGGGVPQWNCNCPNCRAARKASYRLSVIGHRFKALRRTQSSVTVSADGERWLLLNASPDLRIQFASCSAFAPPKGKRRGSPIAGVVLTDGELDHVTGLLSLREQKELRLVCTTAVMDLLTRQFPLLPTLRRYCRVRHTDFPISMMGMRVTALDLSCKTPPYARRSAKSGDVVGLRIESSKTKRPLVYLPCLPAITDNVEKFVCGSDCLLLDGTFWSNDEMTSLGLTKRTAHDMGHIPISGRDGSLAWLRSLKVPRKIYLHINNTNPILRPGSRERRAVERAGVGVAYDGMDIRL